MKIEKGRKSEWKKERKKGRNVERVCVFVREREGGRGDGK